MYKYVYDIQKQSLNKILEKEMNYLNEDFITPVAPIVSKSPRLNILPLPMVTVKS